MNKVTKEPANVQTIYRSYDDPSSDGIDLLALIDLLWFRRKTIIVVLVLGLFMGAATAFISPQRWTSQAVMTAPENIQLTSLRTILAQLGVLGIDPHIDSNTIFETFLKRLDSVTLRQEYIQNSDYLKNILGDDYRDEVRRHQEVISQSEHFQLTNSASNKKEAENLPYSSWRISFKASSALDAQDVLKGYLQFITLEVKKEILDGIQSAVALAIVHSEDQLKLDIANLTNKYNNDIKRLEYSLAVANAAGIKRPVFSNGQAVKDDPDYSVTLGADGISKKLEIEQHMTDITAMNTDIQNRRYRLSQLKQIQVSDIEFTPFNYQMAPSLPVRSDGPRKLLIIILAGLISTLGACGWVLLKHALINYRKSTPLDAVSMSHSRS